MHMFVLFFDETKIAQSSFHANVGCVFYRNIGTNEV